MWSTIAVVFCAVLGLVGSADVKFPSWFKFGTSTSSYQIEGAWNASDKAESIWDRFTHADPTVIADLSNGDKTCDSYHLWRRDVDMAAEMGLQFYRFSISWTRLLPSGYSNHVSSDGARYYSDLIDRLLEKGIEPVVTLYHWDLPQNLQNLGGWTNPLIADWFASYARVVFSLYADRVKTWITINEAIVVCDVAYMTAVMAPGQVDIAFAPFLCNKHLLLAHAKAWRIYDEQFKPLYHGKVSISNHLLWYTPFMGQDCTLTELARDFIIGRYCHPIYSKEGGWPVSTVKIMQALSSMEGYEVSRLPEFSKEEVKLIKGTYDFFAFNYYSCRLVRPARPDEKVDPLFYLGIPELHAVMEERPGATFGVVRLSVLCPEGLRELMSWIKQQYGDLEIWITENGYSTAGSDLNDTKRISYIRDHLEQVLLSINVDDVNVTAYTYWSLMDNFEWMDGYNPKFGLYEVDFSSELRTRTPRSSASFYSQLTRTRTLSVNSSLVQYFNRLKHEKPQVAAKTYNYLLITGGVLLGAIIAVAVVLIRKWTSRKDIYTNVQTEDSLAVKS